MTAQTQATLATRFVEDGYIVVPDLVSPDDLSRIVDDAQRFIAGDYPVSNLPDNGDVLAVHFPHWVSPVAMDMVQHDGVIGVLSQITGAHLPQWDGATKCMQSMLFSSRPDCRAKHGIKTSGSFPLGIVRSWAHGSPLTMPTSTTVVCGFCPEAIAPASCGQRETMASQSFSIRPTSHLVSTTKQPSPSRSLPAAWSSSTVTCSTGRFRTAVRVGAWRW